VPVMREEFPLFRVTHTLANVIKIKRMTKKSYVLNSFSSISLFLLI
jgi:hypothetical protein